MPLPELPETPPVSPVLAIEFGPFDAPHQLRWSILWRQFDGSPWVEVARARGTYYVRVVGFADFRITSTAVHVAPHEGTRPSTIRHLLLDQVLPLALAADGHLVLHASGLVSEGAGAMAIAGPAGSGKSTLAAALQREGWSVASDDGLLMRDEGRHVSIVPAYPGLRLWPDATEITGLTSLAVSEVAEYTAKLRVSLPAVRAVEHAPLRGVYVVEQGDVLSIHRLGARDAAMALVAHAYRADLTDRAALAAQMDACARIAERVPVCRLVMPRDLAQLAAAARTLSAHARVEAQ